MPEFVTWFRRLPYNRGSEDRRPPVFIPPEDLEPLDSDHQRALIMGRSWGQRDGWRYDSEGFVFLPTEYRGNNEHVFVVCTRAGNPVYEMGIIGDLLTGPW